MGRPVYPEILEILTEDLTTLEVSRKLEARTGTKRTHRHVYNLLLAMTKRSLVECVDKVEIPGHTNAVSVWRRAR